MTDLDPASIPEATLVKRLILEGSKLGLRLFRNQVGTYQLKDGRYLTSGLCVGSSDLIGYLPVTITPAMVGRTVAVFVALEAKGPRGQVRKPQQVFIDTCRTNGAITAIVRSVYDAKVAITWWMQL